MTINNATSNRSSEFFNILDEIHLENAVKHMKQNDPKLASYLDQDSLAAFKERLGRADGTNPFKSFTRSIIYQQVSGKSAASVLARFMNLFSTSDQQTSSSNWFPTPEEVLAKSIDDLRSVGLSGRKAQYIQNLAQNFIDKSITPERFSQMSDQEISSQLCAVKGIGQWSVDMFLLLDLHHSDILPLGDLAVRKGIVKHFGLSKPANNKKIFPLPHHMMELTKTWRPYRSLGSWLMWRIQAIKVVGDD